MSGMVFVLLASEPGLLPIFAYLHRFFTNVSHVLRFFNVAWTSREGGAKKGAFFSLCATQEGCLRRTIVIGQVNHPFVPPGLEPALRKSAGCGMVLFQPSAS